MSDKLKMFRVEFTFSDMIAAPCRDSAEHYYDQLITSWGNNGGCSGHATTDAYEIDDTDENRKHASQPEPHDALWFIRCALDNCIDNVDDLRPIMGNARVNKFEDFLNEAMTLIQLHERDSRIEYVVSMGDRLYRAYDAQGAFVHTFEEPALKIMDVLRNTGARMIDNETLRQIVIDNEEKPEPVAADPVDTLGAWEPEDSPVLREPALKRFLSYEDNTRA